MSRSGKLPQTLDYIISFKREGKFGRRLPIYVAVENVETSVRRRRNRNEAETRLHRNRTVGRHWGAIRLFLAKIIVHIPSDILVWRSGETKQFILKSVCRFRLIRAVHQPIVQGELVIKLISRTN